MSNKLIQQLYEAAESKDELSKFDEQKLRRAMEGNNKLGASNKDLFKVEPKFTTCKMYHGCPICYKCLNKASHLYVKCQTCQIPICAHTYKDRAKMIRRENFKLIVSPAFKNAIRELIKESEQRGKTK